MKTSAGVLPFTWAIADDSGNAVRQPFPQFLRFLPNNVIVLARVEVDFLQYVLSATKYHGDVKPMREACFVIDAPASPIVSVCEVRDDKMGSPDFRDDLIVYLVCMLFPIDSDRFISGFFDRGPDAMFPRVFHGIIKPHGHEGLRENSIGPLKFGESCITRDC